MSAARTLADLVQTQWHGCVQQSVGDAATLLASGFAAEVAQAL